MTQIVGGQITEWWAWHLGDGSTRRLDRVVLHHRPADLDLRLGNQGHRTVRGNPLLASHLLPGNAGGPDAPALGH